MKAESEGADGGKAQRTQLSFFLYHFYGVLIVSDEFSIGVALKEKMVGPLMSANKQYASFESGLREIAVAGDLSSQQEAAIGNAIRQASGKVNQLQETLLGGLTQMVADGMKPEKAAEMIGLLGKNATAEKADMGELADMAYAFSDGLKINAGKEMEAAFAMVAAGAKTHAFTLKDMPTLATSFAAKGITGPEAVKEIIASLEVVKGSGSSEEAIGSMTNWMKGISSGDTAQRYEKVGVNYNTSLQDYLGKGYSQYEASLMVAGQLIDQKGAAFKQQWAAAGAKGDGEAQQNLLNSSGLSTVFHDAQTVNHLLAMRQNWDQYQAKKSELASGATQKTLDADSAKQNNTLEGRWRQSQIAMNDLALSVGKALTPALISLADAMVPWLDALGRWAAANPEMVAGIGKAVAGLYAINMAISGVTNVTNTLTSLVDKCKELKAAFAVDGRMRWVVTLFKSIGRGALSLGRILGGGLVRGITIAARAVMFLGRALLMNPIGLIITGIAMSAYLIYRYWGPISAFFKRLWSQVTVAFHGAWSGIKGVWSGVSGWFSGVWGQIKTAFSGGIAGVARLILSWSPLNLFYKAFSGVMKFFGIDMPKSFADFGGNLIKGLVNGIGNALSAAKETIVNFGNSISGWFKETLGIHSPSVVFAGYGDNIAQGVAVGINRTTPEAVSASQKMTTAIKPAKTAVPAVAQLPKASEPSVKGLQANGNPSGQSAGVNVTFAPKITIKGAAPTTEGEITSALKFSLHELEKMMERIVTRRERREYA